MLPLSKLETHRLWHKDRLSVEAVAEIRCNKVNTVLGYLAGEFLLAIAMKNGGPAIFEDKHCKVGNRISHHYTDGPNLGDAPDDVSALASHTLI